MECLYVYTYLSIYKLLQSNKCMFIIQLIKFASFGIQINYLHVCK